MNYCASKPSTLLSGYVKHYWTMENCLSSGEHIQRIVPTGLLDLTFYFDNKPVYVEKNSPFDDSSLLSGQINRYYDIKIIGKLSLFSILFKPHGLTAFFDIPMDELLNQNVPLKFILKNGANELESKLFEAKTFHEKINVVENYLFERLQKTKERAHFKRISYCIQLINQSKGQLGIEQLASQACLGRRQFERTFRNIIGTSPKKFLNIIRFQNTINERAKNTNKSLTDLTYKCGYFDQSHMTNDFFLLSGLSPKQYFTDCEPFSDYFQ